jgi:hypothetical protein
MQMSEKEQRSQKKCREKKGSLTVLDNWCDMRLRKFKKGKLTLKIN